MTSLLITTMQSRAETEKNNQVFLLTKELQMKPWDKAIICEKAPFNSVCMSENEYRTMIKNGKILEIEQNTPCPECPDCPDMTNAYLTVGGISFGLGMLLTLALKR